MPAQTAPNVQGLQLEVAYRKKLGEITNLFNSAPSLNHILVNLKDKILGLIPSNVTWRSLEHRFVAGVLSAASILKAENMDLAVGKSRSSLGVGDARLNAAHFDLPDIKADSEYTLLLSSSAFIPVLKQLSDFTKAQIAITGPESVIAIREGAYLYIVSPNKPDSEASKK